MTTEGAARIARPIAASAGVRRRRAPRVGILLEALEARQLLSSDAGAILTSAARHVAAKAAVPAPVDFSLAVDPATTLPGGTIVSNGQTQITLKLDVTNVSGINSSNGTKGSIQIVAHRSDGVDFPLTTFDNINLGNLAGGKSRILTLSPTIPVGLPDGDYSFNATLVTSLPSDISDNNTASTADAGLLSVTIHKGFFNVSDAIANTTFPASVAQGASTRGSVSVTIANAGNIALPGGLRVKIAIALRPAGAVDASGDIPLGALNNANISGLAPGAQRSFNVNGLVPLLTPLGDYQLVATVTPPASFIESTLDDNTASGGGVSVDAPDVDLAIVNPQNTFPDSTIGGVSTSELIQLKNLGNMPTTGSVTIQVLIGPSDDINAATIATTKSVIVHLNAGQTSSQIPVKVTLPAASSTSTFTLFARIVPTGLSDSNAENNVATLGSVTVQPSFVDLRVASATVPFAANELGGAVGVGTAVVQNAGTRAVVSQVTVTYYASTSDAIDNTAVVVGSRSLNMSLAPGENSSPININLTLPTPPSDTAYHILAKVTSTSLLDTNPANDVTNSLKTVIVSHFHAVFPPTFGDTLTFTSTFQQTSGGTTVQNGNFQTDKALSGTYTFSISTAGSVSFISFALTFQTLNGQLQKFTGNPVYLGEPFLPGGHVIRFGLDSAGAAASMQLGANIVYLHIE